MPVLMSGQTKIASSSSSSVETSHHDPSSSQEGGGRVDDCRAIGIKGCLAQNDMKMTLSFTVTDYLPLGLDTMKNPSKSSQICFVAAICFLALTDVIADSSSEARLTSGSQTATSYSSSGSQGANTYLTSGSQGASPYLTSGSQGATTYLTSGSQGASPYLTSGSQGASPYLTSGSQGASPYLTSGSQGASPYLTSGSQGASPYLTSGSQGASPYLTSGSQGASPYLSSGPQGASPYLTSSSQGASPYLTSGSQGATSYYAGNAYPAYNNYQYGGYGRWWPSRWMPSYSPQTYFGKPWVNQGCAGSASCASNCMQNQNPWFASSQRSGPFFSRGDQPAEAGHQDDHSGSSNPEIQETEREEEKEVSTSRPSIYNNNQGVGWSSPEANCQFNTCSMGYYNSPCGARPVFGYNPGTFCASTAGWPASYCGSGSYMGSFCMEPQCSSDCMALGYHGGFCDNQCYCWRSVQQPEATTENIIISSSSSSPVP